MLDTPHIIKVHPKVPREQRQREEDDRYEHETAPVICERAEMREDERHETNMTSFISYEVIYGLRQPHKIRGWWAGRTLKV
jgi:hypothetical protein